MPPLGPPGPPPPRAPQHRPLYPAVPDAPHAGLQARPPPPQPPPPEFLINSTISRDWSLKTMENSSQSFLPNGRHFSQPTQKIKLKPKREGGRRSRRHRPRETVSSMSDSSDGSASTTARPRRSADSEVNANRRLRNELEDEARLGSTPQLDIDSNMQSLDADASEGPTPELSKVKHVVSNHIFTWHNFSAMRL
jgi:hypothetical protein